MFFIFLYHHAHGGASPLAKFPPSDSANCALFIALLTTLAQKLQSQQQLPQIPKYFLKVFRKRPSICQQSLPSLLPQMCC